MKKTYTFSKNDSYIVSAHRHGFTQIQTHTHIHTHRATHTHTHTLITRTTQVYLQAVHTHRYMQGIKAFLQIHMPAAASYTRHASLHIHINIQMDYHIPVFLCIFLA